MTRRLSELAATLSLAADSVHGAAPEHRLRVSVMAARLAAELALPEAENIPTFGLAAVSDGASPRV